MVRKRHRKPKQTASVSLDEWAERGLRYLIDARYKEAIDAFKRLLKHEARDEWREGLADAYLGRAGELAAKGMCKEALVFLDNLSALGCRRETQALSIACLLCAGKTEQAVQTYLKSGQILRPKEEDHLQALFAAQLVAGREHLLKAFPEDALVVKHYAPINEALHAYCAGDDVATGRLLKTIPYRSPYRDLRTVLSALLLRSTDGQAARDQLSRVDTHSPFAGLARVLSAMALTGPDWLAAVAELGPAAKKYTVVSKGIDDKTFSVLARVQKAADSPKERLKLLTAHARLFDAKALRPVCLSLVSAYPDGLRIYQKQFGQLSDFDAARINALAAEQQRDWEEAFYGWHQALIIVSRKDADRNRLRCALIARHLADIQKRHISPYAENIERFLSFSLANDPDDKPSFLALLQYYKDVDQDNRYRECMERAVKQFPEDSDILLAAIELALARNTFKKAARYAKTLLQLDPINSRVRSLLIGAHLSQARKQIQAGKFHLVEKELDAAQAMEREGYSTGIIQIHRGLLAFAQGQVQEGESQIEEACRRAGSHRVAYFHLVVEAERSGLAGRAIKSYRTLLKQSAAAAPDKHGILALIGVIESCLSQGDVVLDSALAAVTSYLKKGAELAYSLAEMETLCAVFEQLEMYDMLRVYTKQACLRWDAPLFIYYRLVAKSSGDLFSLRPADMEALQMALGTAMERHEADTVKRIQTFLDQFHDSGIGRAFERIGEELGFDEDEVPESMVDLLARFLFNEDDERGRRG